MRKILIVAVGVVSIFLIFNLKVNKIEEEKKIAEEIRRQKQKEEREWCLNRYKELEQRLQKAKNPINDDEEKIAAIKAEAMKIEDPCKNYIGSHISDLIRRCNEEFD